MSVSTQALTPWFKATEHHPGHVGPYRCRTNLPYRGKTPEEQTYHMRWWDGADWSFPLDFDPDLDDEILPPTKEQMLKAADPVDTAILLDRFDWQGYTSDQDPL
jgi:hypothetical protein